MRMVNRTREPTWSRGRRILRIAVDLEALEAGGIKWRVALGALPVVRALTTRLCLKLMQTGGPEDSDPDVIQLLARELKAGMTVVHDVTDSAGRLLVGRGYQVNESLIERSQPKGDDSYQRAHLRNSRCRAQPRLVRTARWGLADHALGP